LMLVFSAGATLFVAPLLAFAQTASGTADATRKFREYLDEDWKRWMQEYPEPATSVGFPGQNRRWTDVSREGIEARIRHLHESLAKLKSISRDALPAGEQLDYDLYRQRLETTEEGLQYGDDPMPFRGVVPFNLWMPMSQMGGIQQGIPSTLAEMPHQTVADYEDILARLETLPKHVEQHIELLGEGLRRGYSPPKFMLRDVPKQIAGLIPADSLASPLLEPFNKFPAGFSEGEKARLTDGAKLLYSSEIVPAIQSFHDFTEFLRTDSRFFYDKPDDLVDGYRIIAKKIVPELAHVFGKLPRLPYGVCVIPDFKAPSETTAYYQAGAPSAGRPGCYFVNTYNLRARPKWEMEALTLHESVPGHHLQISLAQEQQGQPEFRKHSGYSAFVEGWALYSESLGEELGMYKDPYSKFGQLSYEMWRAVRLVVDTGMHSMGWTRQQAIDFFRENTGKTDQDITVEVDRYIVWPGQALAYKIGQMKIRELAAAAEKKLA